ncbi:MAG: BatA domain-containing protein [Phycisphaerae bacterium]
MTLLAPLALLVGLTALVPLILHLYQRRQRAVIEFSTNRFFTASIIRSQRRLRLRRLLLLLLRVATCIFLALALARPLTTLAGFGGRPGARDVVILLDDSLSMRARQSTRRVATGPTRFEQARQLALDALNELTAGDRAAVITFTGRTIGERTHRLEAGATSGLELSDDLLRVTREMERLQPTFAAGDAHAALDHAAMLFQEATPRNRLLLVLSDLQASDWRQMDWPQPIHPISVALVRLSRPPEDNVVADELVLSQGTAVVGQPNLLRVRLLNYRKEMRPAELILHVDGKERLRRPIELAGQSPHVEQIPLVFDRPGEHRLKLHLAARDALAADNTLYAAVRVNPRLPILLVDGQAEAPRGRSAASFLRAALRAITADDDAIQVDTIRPEALTAGALEGYHVVILSAVSELAVAQLESLEQFVQGGGGLANFLGDYADRSFYNEIMGAPTRPLGGLLPAELGTLVESQETVAPLHILAVDLDHPILQRFKGTLRSALAGVTVYRTYAVHPRDAWGLASLDQGLPLLVERSYGAGRVLLCAAAPHPRWTNLPLRRVFVPLCSRTVSYLAAGGTGWHGHLARVVGEDLDLLRGGGDVEQPVYVRRPDGARVRAAVKVVEADPVAYVPADEVQRPGFYRVEGAGAVPAAGEPRGLKPAARAVRRLAVNVPRRESSPEVLDVGAAQKLAGNWRLHVIDAGIRDAGGTREVVAGRRAGGLLIGAGWLSRGVWDTLLWTVFVLVLAEPLIASQAGRFRRNAGAGPRAGRRLPGRAA